MHGKSVYLIEKLIITGNKTDSKITDTPKLNKINLMLNLLR